jgi:hypothetical protein
MTTGGTSPPPAASRSCSERWPTLSVQYYCAASLDGYIAEVDDTIEWLTGYEATPPGEDVARVEGGYDDFYAEVGALVSGSVTTGSSSGQLERGSAWPYAGKPCRILSSRKLPRADARARINRAVPDPSATRCSSPLRWWVSVTT